MPELGWSAGASGLTWVTPIQIPALAPFHPQPQIRASDSGPTAVQILSRGWWWPSPGEGTRSCLESWLGVPIGRPWMAGWCHGVRGWGLFHMGPEEGQLAVR